MLCNCFSSGEILQILEIPDFCVCRRLVAIPCDPFNQIQTHLLDSYTLWFHVTKGKLGSGDHDVSDPLPSLEGKAVLPSVAASQLPVLIISGRSSNFFLAILLSKFGSKMLETHPPTQSLTHSMLPYCFRLF